MLDLIQVMLESGKIDGDAVWKTGHGPLGAHPHVNFDNHNRLPDTAIFFKNYLVVGMAGLTLQRAETMIDLFIANARAGVCVAMKLFFCLLGLVLVIEGLPYFAFPDRMKSWIGKIQEIPDSQLRIMGFFAMCTGLVLVYIFKS